jgi:hypothetical protein
VNKDDPPETGKPGSVGEARLFETSYRRSWPQARLFPTPPRTFLRTSSCRLLLLKRPLRRTSPSLVVPLALPKRPLTSFFSVTG